MVMSLEIIDLKVKVMNDAFFLNEVVLNTGLNESISFQKGGAVLA